MAAEDGSNGVCRGDTKATVLLLSHLHLVSLLKKGWKTQEMQNFAIFVAALTFSIANDKMLIKTLLQVLSLIHHRYCFQQIKNLDYHQNHLLYKLRRN